MDERHVLRIGLVLVAGFVATAVVAFALPAVRSGHWAGVHLTAAGAAMVAVGTFMPHFGVTLAGSTPESPWLRLGGIVALASGALLAVIGVLAQAATLAIAGAALLWLGLGVTAWATLHPAMRPLARRHPMAQLAYAVALAQVALGISLPVLLLIGWEPAVAGWTRLKPAHVWLNLFGFLSLTISATLVYLYPTVLGARIRAHPSLVPMVGGGILGPPLVAIAAVVDSQPLGVAGGALIASAAVGQLAYATHVWRRRGRWTTELGWHRSVIGHFSAAIAWYLVAAVTAAVGIVRDGPAPVGWALGALTIPLIAGWALQVLVGAWTHLVPAVASTEPARRAGQRALLGFAAVPRLFVWNLAVLLAWVGLGSGVVPLTLAGVGAFALTVAVAVAFVLVALIARSGGPTAPSPFIAIDPTLEKQP